MAIEKKVWRSGVRFDCPRCGALLREDERHRQTYEVGCEKCEGELRLVAVSDSQMTGDAKWFKCNDCGQLYMHRRGELVTTQARTGFDEFA